MARIRMMANISLDGINALSRTSVSMRKQVDGPGQGHQFARQQNLNEMVRGHTHHSPGDSIAGY